MSNNDQIDNDNPSANETFAELAARISRRAFLRAGVAATAVYTLDGSNSFLNAFPSLNPNAQLLLGFKGIPVSTADTVIVADGYSAKVLIAWGDPVSDGPAFAQDFSREAINHNNGEVLLSYKSNSDGGNFWIKPKSF